MNKNKIMKGLSIVTLVAFMASCSNPANSDNDDAVIPPAVVGVIISPDLATAADFAVFGGGDGITNQGLGTVIIGHMGTTGASTMVTGFHTATFSYSETATNVGSVIGNVYTDAPEGSLVHLEIAKQAAGDVLAAYNDLAGRPAGIDPGAGQLGGLTLESGVYKSASGDFLVTDSDLTLDAKGNTDAVWIFQMAGTLTVGTPTAPASIHLINGAQAKNVFWQVGSSAIINSAGGGIIAGTIIADAGVVFSTAGNASTMILNGRVLSLTSAITMVNTIINTADAPVL